MAIAIVLILVAVGSVAFHIYSPWWWTEIASNWNQIDLTVVITFWITGIVFVALTLFVAYCVVKFRYSKNRRAEYKPENKKLELWLTILTSLGVIGMLAPGLWVWQQYVSPPPNADEVEIVGQQWQWSFRYPGQDGILGTTDANLVSFDNPFGINPTDPAGQDDILIEGDALHLPLGRPVKFLLRSHDVLHNFFIPQFRAKMDLVPGMVTYFWITPTRTGEFEILCAELCGLGHHQMRGGILIEEEDTFQTWLAEQQTFRQIQQDARLHQNRPVKIATDAPAGKE
ncbi:cytochrome c oxidase subunit II [Sneathiella chinensis]|uniref:cytochrome-c oxidase n=1 Tax=Sneathiella chinensis TaxID=349750 RepID=A0ABQ5U2X8_9PROT|nr:cytochrome c oxidase subunit II [Sneathiella chinensis]GLQ06088.1 cytochrome-c oxidase [Sneathiella chinensis]